MFYFAVVLEKGQIVDSGLDPENEAELVVELDRNRPHGVFDPRPFNAGVETVAYLAFVLRVELAPEKRGDVIRFDAMRRSAGHSLIERVQIGLSTNDDVGRVLALVHAPVLSACEGLRNWAPRPG